MPANHQGVHPPSTANEQDRFPLSAVFNRNCTSLQNTACTFVQWLHHSNNVQLNALSFSYSYFFQRWLQRARRDSFHKGSLGITSIKKEGKNYTAISNLPTLVQVLCMLRKSHQKLARLNIQRAGSEGFTREKKLLVAKTNQYPQRQPLFCLTGNEQYVQGYWRIILWFASLWLQSFAHIPGSKSPIEVNEIYFWGDILGFQPL